MKSTFVTIFLMLMLLEACLSITSEKIAKIEERRRHELGRRRNTQTQNRKSDRVLITFDGTDEEAKQFGEDMGWTWNRKVLTRFEFNIPSSQKELGLYDLQDIDSRVKSVEYMDLLVRVKKAVTVSDAQWSKQWNLQTSQSPSMKVKNAWDKGYNGTGVTIAIVDDGIDTTHLDLAGNYEPSLAYDYIYSSPDASHVGSTDGHGSNCAGVAAAVKNTVCVIGIAYQSSITAVRILDETISATASDEAMALTHKLSSIDIYSNSWGPNDDGDTFTSLPSVVLEALQTGVSQGRNGKGAIYTWASGNGGKNFDDCNADGYANSMYTIAIAAVSGTSSPASYSEHCSAILAATYSGDKSPNKDITTTGPSNTCVNDFSGTSAACPAAAGIIALTLQANPALTWRDVQHLIVETATSAGVNGAFYGNGRGKQVSEYFGFGLMNAEAMVDSAPTWNTVPSRTSCSSPDIWVQGRSSDGNNITSNHNVTKCYIAYLEHVIVTINYESSWRGDAQVYLRSPSGTSSKIFRSRWHDISTHAITWDILSVLTWGEDPDGVWTLTMESSGFATLYLHEWSLKFYGTLTDPLAGKPTAGTYGGACSESSNCSSLTDGGCLEDGLVCVNCNNGYRVIENFCKQDGRLGGYCDDSITCFSNKLECVNNICQTASDDKDDYTGLIVGVVVAGAVVIAVVVFIIIKKCCVAKAKASVAPANSGRQTASHSGRTSGSNRISPYSGVNPYSGVSPYTGLSPRNRVLLPPINTSTLRNSPRYPASDPPPYPSSGPAHYPASEPPPYTISAFENYNTNRTN